MIIINMVKIMMFIIIMVKIMMFIIIVVKIMMIMMGFMFLGVTEPELSCWVVPRECFGCGWIYLASFGGLREGVLEISGCVWICGK